MAYSIWTWLLPALPWRFLFLGNLYRDAALIIVTGSSVSLTVCSMVEALMGMIIFDRTKVDVVISIAVVAIDGGDGIAEIGSDIWGRGL